VRGYQNELEQAILIIISNAQDAIMSNKIQNPIIKISLEVKDEYMLLSICDNAGGDNWKNI